MNKVKFRYWRGLTLVSYWHKGTRFSISMRGRYSDLDTMAAAVSEGAWHILRIGREN